MFSACCYFLAFVKCSLMITVISRHIKPLKDVRFVHVPVRCWTLEKVMSSVGGGGGAVQGRYGPVIRNPLTYIR